MYLYYEVREKRKPEWHRGRSGTHNNIITICNPTNILVFAEKDIERTNGITYYW